MTIHCKISVPGFSAGEISATITNGSISAIKKSSGEYIARPSKKGKASVTLYAKIDGKRTKMGAVEFRVKEVPPPKAKVQLAKQAGGSLIIENAIGKFWRSFSRIKRFRF